VQRLFVCEAAVLAGLGAIPGIAGSILYTHLMLSGLSTIWNDAIGGTVLTYHATPLSLIGGGIGGALLAVFAVGVILRLSPWPDVRSMQLGDISRQSGGGGHPGKALVGALMLTAAAGFCALRPAGSHAQEAAMFFAAGGMLLVASMLVIYAFIKGRLSDGQTAFTLGGVGMRNLSRRSWRSIGVAAMLASGTFLVLSVGARRHDPEADAQLRGSGTGGYQLYVEMTQAIYRDLNTAGGQEAVGLDPEVLEEANIVPMRLRQGDDASCLNLNRAQRPRLLAVNPEALADAGAFTFAAGGGWEALNEDLGDDVVAGVADNTTIMWALGKMVGGTLDYVDEAGRPFKVKLVGGLTNSVFQGQIIIAEDRFVERFPSASGYSLLLVEAPAAAQAAVKEELTVGLQDYGAEVESTVSRLIAFNQVEHTYMSIFQLLGGLGVMLGAIGVGVLVGRNVLERRRELAVMRAIGFSARQLRGMVLHEHWAMVAAGVGAGTLCAVLAVLPVLRSPSTSVPLTGLALTLGGIVFSAFCWTWLAARLALASPLLDALRDD
jgi:hypothetical protein